MSYEEKTEISAYIDDVKILNDILDCIAYSHSDDVPHWYVEYTHDANKLEICLPSLDPLLCPVTSFNKEFGQSIKSNIEDNGHWSPYYKEVGEVIYDAYDGGAYGDEINFADLVKKLFDNIRSKPKLLKSVLASGGVFLVVSQRKYARKVVENFYLWQVESKIQFGFQEYQTKKFGNKYKITISCERDFKTTLNDFWHCLDSGEDLSSVKNRFLESDASNNGQIIDLDDDKLVDQWLTDVGVDYLDYGLVEYFSFDTIVAGGSPLIPGAIGYSHQDADALAFNRSVDYSKKLGEKSLLKSNEDDELEATLKRSKLDLVFPISEVTGLLTKKNYISSIEYIICFWLQGKDLEETEIDWLVCAMSEFGELNIKSLISDLTQKYKNKEIPIDQFLALSKKIPKKLLFQLNCMILKNLPKQLLWDNVSKSRDGNFSVKGELAILKMVCDHNNADFDIVWKQVSGSTFTEVVEYIGKNKSDVQTYDNDFSSFEDQDAEKISKSITQKNYIAAMLYFVMFCEWNRDITEDEISWLVCVFGKHLSEEEVREQIADWHGEFEKDGLDPNDIFAVGSQLSKKLLTELNKIILRRLEDDVVSECIEFTGYDDKGVSQYDVVGPVAGVMMVSDQNNLDIDKICKASTGMAWGDWLDYMNEN